MKASQGSNNRFERSRVSSSFSQGVAWFLRGKYFFPWVRGPANLNEYSLFPRILFLGARFGAMLLIVSTIGFFVLGFWDVAH
jgi:hypothetical protein